MTQALTVDQLYERFAPLGDLEISEMMGGQAIYCNGFFFGIMFKGKLYFKTNDRTAADYRSRGMGPFAPSTKVKLTNFHEVPPDVLAADHLLLDWATRSIGTENG